MKRADLTKPQSRALDKLLSFYTTDAAFRGKLGLFESSLTSLIESSAELRAIIHSFRTRIKESDHLEEKILRKSDKYFQAGKLLITPANLGTSVNDLVGLRLLHLHTTQIVEIDRRLRHALDDFSYKIREGPIARTWDNEYKKYYTSVGITPKDSPNMYTSVHYVIDLNNRAADLTAEIQVRSLAEELWGEVDHSLNYPDDHASEMCRAQINVLARITSGATRLVDAIYMAADHHEKGI